ncbi:type II toxin-antitoxin system RelE/ParE family toxin [Trinickia sp. EG282A]|uniref:type II toxin-antitoxin system RelE/ParE family toxin n=1 Tax=Trinickia sp. EG282A TaxID=3237013 RepID=UPI0034D30E25
MTWDVEYTDHFGAWWDELVEAEQESIAASVRLLENYGPNLRHPYSSGINSSRHGHLRELRVQHEGRPYRVLYAFDPRRTAILLLGGDKTGNDRWYDVSIPRADALYEEHLAQLKQERFDDG